MVEAAIVLPIIVILVIVLLRMFTFYLQILDTGIKAHEAAIEKSMLYDGTAFNTYKNEEIIYMFGGAMLAVEPEKHINVKAYLINEDAIVRAGEFIG